ncbi:peptidase inhibitor family I36 protein [Nonomuraea sp. NBC_01738]|uniref:peptidase inhibitor family I36 protein n=1 Tax=Nonomuraea sp. NBC_01738 TaxID=2976003 RepID=UPI002E1237AC|nr:peptidase inhibitor family I36 protein [Nonomuraea sp. NBC_01738]
MTPLRKALTALAGVALAGALTAAIPASAQAANCPANAMCVYDGHDLNGLITWTPGNSCGWRTNLGDFSPPQNDKVSSVWNNSDSRLILQDWRGYWATVLEIPAHQSFNLWYGDDNIVDAYVVQCY